MLEAFELVKAGAGGRQKHHSLPRLKIKRVAPGLIKGALQRSHSVVRDVVAKQSGELLR